LNKLFASYFSINELLFFCGIVTTSPLLRKLFKIALLFWFSVAENNLYGFFSSDALVVLFFLSFSISSLLGFKPTNFS